MKSLFSKCMLALLLLATCNVKIWPQESVGEFYPLGTTWTDCWFDKGQNGDETIINRRYCVSKDTVINGKNYKQVDVDEQFQNGEWKYLHSFYIFQDGMKVYYYGPQPGGDYDAPESFKEYLRYDFSWVVGGETPASYNYDGGTYTMMPINDIRAVAMKDGTVLDGLYTNGSNGIYLAEIKTIGYVTGWNGLFEDYGWWSWSGNAQFNSLTSFTRNGVTLWQRSYDEILDIRNVVSSLMKDDTVYSLDGIRQHSAEKLRPGIYIRGGRKVVISRRVDK